MLALVVAAALSLAASAASAATWAAASAPAAAAAPAPAASPPHYSFASPRNVSFVRTLFSDGAFGYRDPTAPVFDGRHWHVWATRVLGTEGGYGGVVCHLYSDVLDARWKDGGLALNRSGTEAWDSHGVFTPSVAWEGPGGAVVAAPLATKWILFFGGVSHAQGPIYDEALGIATAASPFGPWTKHPANPIITGRDPNVPWCDPAGPGKTPGVLHVDEAEPYVLHGQRRLYVKTICRNHTVLPSIFVPANGSSSWGGPYVYDTRVAQPVIPPTSTPSGRGMEQARLFLGPDGRLHLTARAYDGFNPHFISTDGNVGTEWALVEKMLGWGGAGGVHELTPVGPAGRGPGGGWLGPPGVSGVAEYFIQFAGSPRYHIELLKVNWQNSSGPAIAA